MKENRNESKKRKRMNNECSLCVLKKKRSDLYSHICNNLICSNCIFTNILIYLRIECPYCRLEYSIIEFKVLKSVYKNTFDNCNKNALNKLMFNVESGYDMMTKLTEQNTIIEKYKIDDSTVSFMDIILTHLIKLDFEFILAIQKGKDNIIIVDEEWLFSLMTLSIWDKHFFKSFSIGLIIVYDKNKPYNITMPIYLLKDALKICEHGDIKKLRINGNISAKFLKNEINIGSKLEKIDDTINLRMRSTISDMERQIILYKELNQRIITMDNL